MRLNLNGSGLTAFTKREQLACGEQEDGRFPECRVPSFAPGEHRDPFTHAAASCDWTNER